VMPYLYPHVHSATLRVLRRNGCEVVVPSDQVCCGALNVHSGERQMAREMARRNVKAFAQKGLDAVIVNAAGCGSTLKEYSELLGNGRNDVGASGGSPEQFSQQVKDVNEFLWSIDLEPATTEIRRRVTLQESCHLVHAQRIKDAPRKLLAFIPGLELADMAHPDLCCGSAGIYSLTQPRMAASLLQSKMADIQATSAQTIVTANPGCMLQLEQGVRQSRMRMDVKHVVQVLDAAYGHVEG
jgi:glycolate oxidase iron-sulfur subunit